ncbi:potassium channel family protein [Tritonibacter scottomollicae]|uniref:Ion channel n=1 Tax=Tritonibacter scottomollicae TaxID=483013 RepID=A0A2T1AHA6_TRISK|nr:potassium channel family protein [Tritonibacter scottomollicae]PRZ47936.1 ion channel [Tritonibacter scottomollicae]
MTLIQQIFWGSLFLGLCLVLETIMLLWCGDTLRRHKARFGQRRGNMQQLVTLLISIGFVVGAHTAQIWIWSAALILKAQTFETWNAAVYFSIATYTTLGYGDIVLDAEHRIFASFAAMTGMLAFGISTAFLVAVMRPGRPDSPFRSHT